MFSKIQLKTCDALPYRKDAWLDPHLQPDSPTNASDEFAVVSLPSMRLS